jgi:hypothetical protein
MKNIEKMIEISIGYLTMTKNKLKECANNGYSNKFSFHSHKNIQTLKFIKTEYL